MLYVKKIYLASIPLYVFNTHIMGLYSPNDPRYFTSFQELRRTTPEMLTAHPEPLQNYIKGLQAFYGMRGERNQAEGIRYITLASRTMPLALATLADFYYFGNGIPVNRKMAFLLFKKAADNNNAYSLAMLFTKPFYATAQLTFSEVTEWGELVENAAYKSKLYALAQAGNMEAQYALGSLLMKGAVFTKNIPEGLKLLKAAAAQNHIAARHTLGKLYQHGTDVPQDEELALTYFEQVSRYRNDMKFDYAALLTKPHRPFTNFPKAIQLFKELCAINYPHACKLLASNAFFGIDDSGAPTEPDYDKAFALYQKAVDFGDQSTLYMLANMYYYGLGTPADPEKANRMYKQILDSQDPTLLITQALMHEHGVGTPQNLEMAQALYKKLASVNIFAQKRFEALANKAFEIPTTPKKEKSKGKGKAKATIEPKETSSEEQAGSSELHEAIADIDIAGERLKTTLNTALSYDDQSIITGIDTHNNTITIKNPYDNSVVTITIDRLKPVTQQDLNSLVKFTYDDRIKEWFKLKEHTQTVDRHRFAQRIDEIMQLYGTRAYFIMPNGDVSKNSVMAGTITRADGSTLPGTFEYAFYTDPERGEVLYHRFFHPRSRAQTTYPKSVATHA